MRIVVDALRRLEERGPEDGEFARRRLTHERSEMRALETSRRRER